MQRIVEIVIFAVLMIVVTAISNVVMRSKKFKVNRIVNMLLAAAMGVMLVIRFDTIQEWLYGMALFEILLYASISDITFHEADDYLWIMIALLSLMKVEERGIAMYLLGGIVTALPFFLSCFFCKSKPIGGADIKMAFAMGLVIGVQKGTKLPLIGMFIAVIITTFHGKVVTKSQNRFFLIPYLSLSYVLIFIL